MHFPKEGKDYDLLCILILDFVHSSLHAMFLLCVASCHPKQAFHYVTNPFVVKDFITDEESNDHAPEHQKTDTA